MQELVIQKPPAERIAVPTDRLGDGYAGQWVERRLGADDLLEGYVGMTVAAPGFRNLDPWTQLTVHAKVMSLIFPDWSLAGDAGPLPKPWLHPGAILDVWMTDYQLFLWLMGLTSEFVRRVTSERRESLFDGILEEMLQKDGIAWRTND